MIISNVFRISPSLVFSLLLGCNTVPNDPVPSDMGTCGVSSQAPLVGRNVAEIDADTLPQHRRVIFATPSGAGRTDPSRLTIVADRAGRIKQVWCG